MYRSVIKQAVVQKKAGFRWLLMAAGLPALAGVAHGQEALRLSMAGDTAAAQQSQYDASIGYYNLLVGPTAWRFSSGLTTEYNDNVRLQEDGESDLIIRPSVNTQMHWPVSPKNSLDVSLYAGYSEYLQHSDLSQFFITPGSGLSFDVYAGDFKINLHDRVNITEEAYENAGTSANNQNLMRLQNTAGTSALWDLNKALANIGYDHVDYVSLSQSQGVPDASSENVTANGGIRVLPELLLGLEGGGSIITYSQNNTLGAAPVPNALQWNFGGFGSEQVSDYINIRLDAGYTAYTPDGTTPGLLTSDTSGFYFSLALSHQVNQYLSYSLTAGRTTDLSYNGQAQSYNYVRLNSQWSVFKNYQISTPIWWQQGTWLYNSSFQGTSDYQQIGVGFTVTRRLTKKLSASAGYQFVDQTSNRNLLRYNLDIVKLSLTYQF
jgi:hypothetical protein